MTNRDKVWLAGTVLAVLWGIAIGEPVMDWLDSEPALEYQSFPIDTLYTQRAIFVDVTAKEIIFPAVIGRDTVLLAKRLVNPDDTVRIPSEYQVLDEVIEGKRSIIRRVR